MQSTPTLLAETTLDEHGFDSDLDDEVSELECKVGLEHDLLDPPDLLGQRSTFVSRGLCGYGDEEAIRRLLERGEPFTVYVS